MEPENLYLLKKLIKGIEELVWKFRDLVLEAYSLNKLACICTIILFMYLAWKIFLKDYWKMLLLLGPTTLIAGLIINIFLKNDVKTSIGLAGVLFLGVVIFYGNDVAQYFIRNSSVGIPWTKRDEQIKKGFNDASIWVLYIAFYCLIAALKVPFFTVLIQRINPI